MKRALALLIGALAVGGGLLWLVSPARDGRRAVARAGPSAASDAAPARSETGALAAPPLSSTSAESAADETPPASVAPEDEPGARRVAATPYEEELARAQWVEGRVVFPPGTPLDEQAFVTAQGKDFEHGPDQRAEVGADGRFRVAFSEKARGGWLSLEARYLYLEENVRWKGSGADEPIALEPELGGRISGRLVAPAGADPARIGGWVHAHGGAVTIGTDPVFAFGALPCDTEHRVTYYGEQWFGASDELEVEAGRTSDVVVALQPAVTLNGFVRDEAGAPLADVSVVATVESGSGWSSGDHGAAQSHPDGSFRLGGLAPGDVTLNARLKGYIDTSLELGAFALGQAREGIALVLSSGNKIAGRVLWPDGSPAEAWISIEAVSEVPSPAIAVRAGADGTFHATGLGQGPFHVGARATKTEDEVTVGELTGRELKKKRRTTWTAERADVMPGGAELVLTLGTGLGLEGRVVDDLGAPVVSFRLRAERQGESESDSDFGDSVASRFRDDEGRFLLQGLTPGDWRLTVDAAGHASPSAVRFRMPDAGPQLIVVPREALVTGVVLDSRGEPVSGAQVRADQGADDETDKQGVFKLRGLPAGPTQLTATGPGGAPSPPLQVELVQGSTVEGLVLHLRPGARIHGVVLRSNGRPAADQMVWASSMQEGSWYSDTTDEQGGFELEDLPAGDFQLSAETGEGLELTEHVSLGEGETVRVRLAAEGRLVRLHGRVLVGGEPAVNAQLNAWLTAGSEGTSSSGCETDDEGNYELTLPGSGPTSLEYSEWRRGFSWSTTFELPAVDDHVLDLSIPVARISGKVSDAEGRPLQVYVQGRPEQRGDDPERWSWSGCDADGRYELTVTPGRYTVVAGGDPLAGSNYAAARAEGVAVAEDGHVQDVDFVLGEGGTLEGRVRHPDGSPAEGAWIWVRVGAGAEHVGATDEDGSFRLVGQEPGTCWVGASTGGAASAGATRVEIVAGETTRVELQVAPATTVAVSVRDAQGRPAGCELRVLDGQGQPCPAGADDVPGEFSLVLAAGTYDLVAVRGDQRVERRLELDGSSPTLELELVFE